MWNPIDIAPTGEKPFTDYSRWRLLVNDAGRHTWHYLRTEEELANWPQNVIDKFWLDLIKHSIYLPTVMKHNLTQLCF